MAFLSRKKQLEIRNREIFRLHTKDGFSYSELKKRCGLSRGRIGQIINDIRAAEKGEKSLRREETRQKLDNRV